MVDNRSAGFYGIGGGFNFKSGDISGTAAKTSDEKQDQGTEYMLLRRNKQQEEDEREQFVDRSAQLRASLNSLAALNAANIKLKKDDEKQPRKQKALTKKEQQIAENEAERR